MAKAKKGGDSRILDFIAWFTGVVVSIVVGFGMIEGVLRLPWWLGGLHPAGMMLVQVVGYIVVISTLISAVLAIIRK